MQTTSNEREKSYFEQHRIVGQQQIQCQYLVFFRKQGIQRYIYKYLIETFQSQSQISAMGNCTKAGKAGKAPGGMKESISKKQTVIAQIDYPQSHSTPQTILSVTTKCLVSGTEKIKVKVPENKRKTTFVWMEEPTVLFPKEFANFSSNQIKLGTFQQKLAWFRLNLEKNRVPWQQGSETLKIDRWNILFSSIAELRKLDLFKEMKINFNDEGTNDAGGLLRQWMHLCIKEIMSHDVGLFTLCNTDETAYQIKWNKNHIDQYVNNYLQLIGLIMGKAIFQRISLNCFLDRTMIRQICGQPIHLCDVYSYDKDLYNSWVSILNEPGIQDFALNFSVMVTFQDGTAYEVQLVPGGKGIKVTDQNKKLFVQEIVQLYCCKNTQKYLQVLKKSLNRIISPELLSVFEPHQFQMILNGPSIIDIQDWKEHTVYEGYSKDDDIIKWFWLEVNQYGQEQLKNLLHYCTGSTRVPILGFKHLQSNRGEVKPFTIRKAQLVKANPYPKSHTCFNRLELPAYQSQQELGNHIRIIMFEEFNHFGLD